jgi:riboflavin biosynthesis pyrimidine reductase
VRKIFPADAAAPEIGSDGIDALAELYAYPAPRSAGSPWLRANMIESIDGAASLDGRSGGLSGDADRQVFRVLRSLADVILVGAGTARAEKYRPVREREIFPALREGQAATPPIAVVTRELDLDLDSPLLSGAAGGARTILLTTEAAPAGRRAAAAAHADVVVAGRDSVTPAAAVKALSARDHRRVLVEGGPTLLRQIADAGLLDDLCLTLSPVLEGGRAGRIQAPPPAHLPGPSPAAPFMAAGPGRERRAGTAAWHSPAARMSLAHVLEDGGSLLCRYLRAPRSLSG